MRILVAIDDTDNLESIGTGKLASMLSESLNINGWGKGGFITRHQMFVHPDIPYTSHNSAMCFEAEIDKKYLYAFVEFTVDFLKKKSAEGSDPGFCFLDIDSFTGAKELMAFGYSGKKQVIKKADAYELAKRLDVHLSEHGGTGQGVIGALAAVGLRLTGNDGRIKGHLKIESANGIVTPDEIKRQTHVEAVQSIDEGLLIENDKIRLGDKVKAVLLEGKSTLLVNKIDTDEKASAKWETCGKQQLRAY
ncbi:MAG: hypothetical protein KKC46_15770 [Proteobacteria bacterium]|nr:hypothetical protein [Pseudomonadota bacterium]